MHCLFVIDLPCQRLLTSPPTRHPSRLPPTYFLIFHMPYVHHKVGGHQRKANRKGVGSGSSGGGGNGHGCYNWDDWRLSPAQKTTLAEAYSDEPGTKPYVPDASTGWKHQKSPWSTGKVGIGKECVGGEGFVRSFKGFYLGAVDEH